MSILDSLDSSTLDRLRDPRDRAAWIEEQADLIAAEMVDAMSRIVRGALENFAATIPALTAAGDFTTLDVIPTEWERAVSQVMPSIEGMYLGASLNAFTVATDRFGELPDTFTRGWLSVVNTDAANYIQDATNKIVNAGEDVWRSVKVDVGKSIAQGTSNEDLKKQIEKTTGYSEFRADTIARTETHRAYQAGNYQANKALGKFGATYKQWLATGDSRTRQTHLDAQALGPIPYDQPFIVGGEELMYPGDEAGSAGEVINCRCTMQEYFPGDEALDGTIIPGEDFLETEEYAALAEPEPVYTAAERRVQEAAEEFGVSPDEVRVAMASVDDARASMRADIADTRARAVETILEGGRMKLPSQSTYGDYDWWQMLSKEEQSRVRRNWMVRDFGQTPDQIAATYVESKRFTIPDAWKESEVVENIWLRNTRIVDAANNALLGRRIRPELYSYGLDLGDLMPRTVAQGYDPQVMLTAKGERLAAHIASVDQKIARDYAEDVLAVSIDAAQGPPPWRMSFQSWEGEVEDLLAARRETGAWTLEQAARWDELIPEQIDMITNTYEEAYSLTVQTARQAGQEVADYARIPWQD